VSRILQALMLSSSLNKPPKPPLMMLKKLRKVKLTVKQPNEENWFRMILFFLDIKKHELNINDASPQHFSIFVEHKNCNR